MANSNRSVRRVPRPTVAKSAGAERMARGARAGEGSDALASAMARTVSDARELGNELATAGVTISKTTVRLVYDVGAVMNLAGQRAVGGVVAAAQDAVRGTRGYVSSLVSESAPRKPLARVGRGPARRVREAAAQA
jgi:hypothetical protein